MKAVSKSLAVSALALCLMSTSALAAELRFTIWSGNEAHLKMLNGIADSFKATHPDVTVKFETIPPADYTQKLTFQLAGGNTPDLGIQSSWKRWRQLDYPFVLWAQSIST